MSNMANILLVEDAPDCQLLVRETLSKVASIRIASTLNEAKMILNGSKCDLIILDMSLPDGDGMEFFSGMQSQGHADVPVIFLTAKGESAVQVAAFSLGADDYVVKPIRPIEFRARVEAKLKKIASKKRVETVLKLGELQIELGTQRAWATDATATEGKRELELTGREFKLLYHLARNEGQVFGRDQLIAAVWGTGVHVLDRTVDTHVYTLRKKLGEFSHYIESEVGQGYRFDAAGSKGAKKAKTAA